MRNKSDALYLIHCFFTFVKTRFNKCIKDIRTDNAKELQLTSFLQSVGATHQFSCPHRPQQNSVAERKHQHLLNVARALLFQSKVPLCFWGECISTTAFLINRVPSTSLQDCSPYELLHDALPDYSILRTFGSLCFASTTPAQRHKFTPRAIPCVFMGYPIGVKGYKLYDIQQGKFLISRDVMFHESIFPYHSATDNCDPTLLGDFFADMVIPRPIPDFYDLQVTKQQAAGNSVHPCTTPMEVATAPVRRSTRVHRTPSYLKDYQCQVTYPIQQYLSYDKLSTSYRDYVLQVGTIFEPSFIHQAVPHPEWRKAMAEELVALEANDTWTVQPLPPGKKSIECRWVYKVKCNADGSLDRYKARLVAQGFTQ